MLRVTFIILLYLLLPACRDASNSDAPVSSVSPNLSQEAAPVIVSSQSEPPKRTQSAAAFMDRFAWDFRPVLVFEVGSDDERANKQLAMLQADQPGLDERQITLIRVPADDTANITQDGRAIVEVSPADLRQHFNVGDGFAFLLVGKDTGVKLRSLDPVSLDVLFATIDMMPMRRNEMRRRQNPS